MNIGKIGKNIVEVIGFTGVLLMVLVFVPSAVTAQSMGTCHGNAASMKEVINEKSDGHGNEVTVVGDAYALFGSNGDIQASAFIFTEYLSLNPNDKSWTLKQSSGNAQDTPTTQISLSNPISGGASRFKLSTVTPLSINKKEPAGTVTYTYGVSANMGVAVEGVSASIDSSAYVTWSSPVYYYQYGPRTTTNTDLAWWGYVSGDTQYARHFSAGVAVKYVSVGEQSIHYSFTGRFHHTAHWYLFWENYDTSATVSGNLSYYYYGGGGGGGQKPV